MVTDHYTAIADWLEEGAALFRSMAEPEPTPEPEPEPEPPVTGPGPDLPTLVLDKQASVDQNRIVTAWPDGTPAHYAHQPKGCIIECGGGEHLPSMNWALRLDHNAKAEAEAEFYLREAHFKTPGNQMALNLFATHHVPRVKFVLQNCHLIGGATAASSGHTLSIPFACDVEIYKTLLHQGYNCLFAANADTNILMEKCELLHGAGNGNGNGHNIYVNYIRSLVMRDCESFAPRSMGHAVKAYAQRFVMDSCGVGHILDPSDLDQGYYGTLPPLDRGAFGQSVVRNSRFYREAPDARPHFMELRNRRFAHSPIWPWEPDYHEVDNRDPDNPHLLHHFFVGNDFYNQVEGGVILRNNGTAPEVLPTDWKDWHHRAVARMIDNGAHGNPLERVYDRQEYQRPEAGNSPIREMPEMTKWAQQKIEEIVNG